MCYKPKDVQRILNISQGQSYNLFTNSLEGEHFPSFRVGTSWRVTVSDFEKWVKHKQKQ